ncbi:MAG: argininosuccinate lyase [Myxococcales bacterium]
MSEIARTQATGSSPMLADLVSWSSSLSADRTFVREDLLGSAAHVIMLARSGIVAPSDAHPLRHALLALFDDTERGVDIAASSLEEDIHMAVEARLTQDLGPVAAKLHTARSRNDQVALDLRLYVRNQAALTLRQTTNLVVALSHRAELEQETLLAAYTHRQRAQPITAAFLIASWGFQLLRAAETVAFALDRSNELPLGVGACSGTSLPIDRPLTARLLSFPRVTGNALDTVADRDFALDWTWAGTRVLLALGKLSADLVDYSTREFGLVSLDGEISAGSSMMPQKKNPDLFELVRAQSSRAIGNVVSLLTLVKGLPSGYNRDQQEDRNAILSTGPLVQGALHTITTALPHVHFNPDAGHRALADGFTQATDLAEALVRRGIAFRDAYRAAGALVRLAIDSSSALSDIPEETAKTVHPFFDRTLLQSLDPKDAARSKESPGGTGPRSVAAQLTHLRNRSAELAFLAESIPPLATIARTLALEPLQTP